jgi:hypothetical protein
LIKTKLKNTHFFRLDPILIRRKSHTGLKKSRKIGFLNGSIEPNSKAGPSWTISIYSFIIIFLFFYNLMSAQYSYMISQFSSAGAVLLIFVIQSFNILFGTKYEPLPQHKTSSSLGTNIFL